jgi:hypothetical protein
MRFFTPVLLFPTWRDAQKYNHISLQGGQGGIPFKSLADGTSCSLAQAVSIKAARRVINREIGPIGKMAAKMHWKGFSSNKIKIKFHFSS